MDRPPCIKEAGYRGSHQRYHTHIWRPERASIEGGLVEQIGEYLAEHIDEIVDNWEVGSKIKASQVGRAIGFNTYSLHYPSANGADLFLEFWNGMIRYKIQLAYDNRERRYTVICWERSYEK